MKLFYCDCETTGTDPQKHGLIQIAGFIEANENTTSFDFKIKPFPEDVIDEKAMAVHGQDVTNYEDPKVVYQNLTTLLGQFVDKYDKKDKFFWIGYNARFDSDFVRRFFEKCGDPYFGSWFYFPPIDVMNLAITKLMGVRSEMQNFKLGTVADKLGIMADGLLHDGLIDIRLTKRIFEQLTKEESHGLTGKK